MLRSEKALFREITEYQFLSASNHSERWINYIKKHKENCKQTNQTTNRIAFTKHMNELMKMFIIKTMPITRRTQFYGLIQLISFGVSAITQASEREKEIKIWTKYYMKIERRKNEILSTNLDCLRLIDIKHQQFGWSYQYFWSIYPVRQLIINFV